MYQRNRVVPSSPESLRGRHGPSAGKRKTPVATKNTKRDLESSPIVYVEWVDAVSDGGWEDNVKVDIHAVCTVGFLIAETKDGICLASTVSGDNSNARMHIPKSWITKRKVINRENKQRKAKGKAVTAVDSKEVAGEVSTVDGQGLTQLSNG